MPGMRERANTSIKASGNALLPFIIVSILRLA
jgi:hypothetical protein